MTETKIRSFKNREKLVMLTAYDALTARILADLKIDIILVGDSLGMAFSGHNSTLPVTLDELIYHVMAVRRGAPDSFIVADMPFLSYGVSIEESVRNAGKCLKEAMADAVKLEGGSVMAPTVSAMTKIGIPVMGHIGLKPQSLRRYGHRIMGKTISETEELIKDAAALQDAGAFSIVLEGTTEEAARDITEKLTVPTIGIGAGRYTDGQVLVITDMLGLDRETDFRHNKKFADLYGAVSSAVKSYIAEVKDGLFPAEVNVFHRE
jgi:3-methyl-2-oxobutanoate hydroxymethyltransferase